MLFLAILVLATLASAIVARKQSRRNQARYGLAIAMAVAGVAHLAMPTPFVQHLPTWVAARDELIFFTGFVEIALGAALFAQSRWLPWTGLALAAYLIAVFPANIYVAVEGVEVQGQPGGLYPWLRLLLQPVFVLLSMWTGRGFEALSTVRGRLQWRDDRSAFATPATQRR